MPARGAISGGMPACACLAFVLHRIAHRQVAGEALWGSAAVGGRGCVMFKIKRAYESPARNDGFRVLVERLWPRGVRKDEVALDAWLKEVAPSPELRKWFSHDPAKWDAFRKRYWSELKHHPDAVGVLKQKSRAGTVTLVYGSRDEQHNAAVALRDFLEHRGD